MTATDLDTPAFDLPSLLNRCMGKAALVEKLLRKFEQQLGPQLAEIDRSIAAADLAAIGRAAHGLKGASANLSAVRLSAVAAELEHLSSAEQAATCYGRLSVEASHCLNALPSILQQLKPAT